MAEAKRSSKVVCVTGGAGYIGSTLVKKLLENGYTVHATLRNLEDESKVGLLKSFPGADKRLQLFQADIYKPETFELPIQGCEFVFHVATPLLHSQGFQYTNTTEATIAGVKKIGMACLKSGTVKKLIYTASVVAASPLNEEAGSGYKALMDESCWTPLNFSNAYTKQFLTDYVEAKMVAEKEMLKFGKEGLEVVTLGCGLIGGGSTCLPYIPGSTAIFLSMFTHEDNYLLKFLEELLGKVPIVHIEDVCEAHLFCMEAVSIIGGRFLCASSFVSTAEIATYYQQNYPQFPVNQEYLNDPKREVEWGSRKLVENGFLYNYGMKEILDDSVACARNNAFFSNDR